MRVTQRERWRGSAQHGKPNAQPPAWRDCRFVALGALSPKTAALSQDQKCGRAVVAPSASAWQGRGTRCLAALLVARSRTERLLSVGEH